MRKKLESWAKRLELSAKDTEAVTRIFESGHIMKLTREEMDLKNNLWADALE